jgi:hypothetical protein
MYKKRIAQWGLYKNYKAAEKEQIAAISKAYQDRGRNAPLLTVRGRPAKLERVRRFYKRTRATRTFTSEVPVSSSSVAIVNADVVEAPILYSSQNGKISPVDAESSLSKLSVKADTLPASPYTLERPFNARSCMSRIELVLLQTQHYLNWQFSTSFSPVEPLNNVWRLLHPSTLWKKYSYGLHMLKQSKSGKAWRLIQEACELVHPVISQPFRGFLAVLYLFFSDQLFNDFPELRQHLLHFFAKTSFIVHGKENPLSLILFHAQDLEVLFGSTMPVFELMKDIFKNNLVQRGIEVWCLKVGSIAVLRRRGDYEAAESTSLKLLAESEELNCPIHNQTRADMRRLGRLYLDGGMERSGDALYQEALNRRRLHLDDDFRDKRYILAIQNLATVYSKRRCYSLDEVCWRAMLDGLGTSWGPVMKRRRCAC